MLQIILFVASSISCPPIQVVADVDYALTKKDLWQVQFSQLRCEEKFRENSCLKRLHIISTGNYGAMCGKAEND